MATKTEYCSCGASIKIMGASRVGVEKAITEWRKGHVGDGHGPATRQVAYMARIKNDKRAAQEVKGETTLEPLSELD
jgi:hypothetical protein